MLWGLLFWLFFYLDSYKFILFCFLYNCGFLLFFRRLCFERVYLLFLVIVLCIFFIVFIDFFGECKFYEGREFIVLFFLFLGFNKIWVYVVLLVVNLALLLFFFTFFFGLWGECLEFCFLKDFFFNGFRLNFVSGDTYEIWEVEEKGKLLFFSIFLSRFFRLLGDVFLDFWENIG